MTINPIRVGLTLGGLLALAAIGIIAGFVLEAKRVLLRLR